MRSIKLSTVLFAALTIFFLSEETFAKKQNPPLSPPPSTKAMVVFYRPNIMSAKSVKYTMYHQGNPIGLLKDGTYFTFVVSPGKQTFLAKSPSKSDITLDLETGKTYFVQIKAKGFSFPPKAKMTLMDENKGRNEYQRCKYYKHDF